jgi:SAM-dependent methyltransferase
MDLSGEHYFQSCYQDYERQTSRRKLSFYLGLVTRWVPQGGRLFELGTGMGHFLSLACERYACGGSDVNDFAVKAAGAKAPKARVQVGSYECIPTIPVPDVVVSWDVLEHIERLDEAIDTIHQRLADNGILIGVVPVYDGPLGWLVHRLDKDPTHLHKVSRKQWSIWLQNNGFTILQDGGILRRLLMGRWYLHLTRPQWMLRSIGCAYYFVARKQSPSSTNPLSPGETA